MSSSINPNLEKPTRLFLLLTGKQWLASIAVGVFLTAIFYPWYCEISFWIAVSLFLSGVVTVQLAYASRYLVPLPHIAILIASLQYVLAAWLSYYFPPSSELYDIGPRLSEYLSFAGPVLAVVMIGWYFALVGLRPTSAPKAPKNISLRFDLDLLYYGGLAVTLVGNVLQIESLAFVVLLVGNLRYVGVFGRMVLRVPGWRWRLALVIFIDVLFAANATMFHDLLLWSAWTFALWIYCVKPAPKVIMGAVAAGVLLLPGLQEAKWQLRDGFVRDDFSTTPEDLTSGGDLLIKPVRWVSYMGQSLGRTVALNFDPEFVADMAVRYNQGWIINRVMVVVPAVQPFAEGATIMEAAQSAVLPRFIAPEKATAGGREKMLTYANIDLNERTAMNLGYAGEMYANFGLTGGIIGCFAYALAFGLFFRFLMRLASTHPLWWAVLPFIFYAGLKAEDDITFVINWMAKACVVILGICFVLPAFREALWGRTGRDQSRFASDPAARRMS